MKTLPNEPPASSAEPHRPFSTWQQPALLLAFLLRVIYPLSIGPALQLATHSVIPFKVLDIYEPLTPLCDYCGPPATLL